MWHSAGVGGWRLMYGASAVPAVILLAGMVCPSCTLCLSCAYFSLEALWRAKAGVNSPQSALEC